MLQAMNTGHDGSLSTGHANSPHDIISRIETMVLQGQDFPLNAIREDTGLFKERRDTLSHRQAYGSRA